MYALAAEAVPLEVRDVDGERFPVDARQPKLLTFQQDPRESAHHWSCHHTRTHAYHCFNGRPTALDRLHQQPSNLASADLIGDFNRVQRAFSAELRWCNENCD